MARLEPKIVLICLQVVVHGIPWSYDDQQLMAIFTDRIPSTQIESAEVVYGRDSRSRVCTNSCINDDQAFIWGKMPPAPPWQEKKGAHCVDNRLSHCILIAPLLTSTGAV